MIVKIPATAVNPMILMLINNKCLNRMQAISLGLL